VCTSTGAPIRYEQTVRLSHERNERSGQGGRCGECIRVNAPVRYEATLRLRCYGRGVHGPAATATASDDSSASAAFQGPPTVINARPPLAHH
jgi:hypothetical protein